MPDPNNFLPHALTRAKAADLANDFDALALRAQGLLATCHADDVDEILAVSAVTLNLVTPRLRAVANKPLPGGAA